MKTSTSPLYPNDEVATSVTNYSSKQSIALPEHVTKYHAWLFDARPDANLAISIFQSQALAWLARTLGAKRVLEIGVYVGYSAMVWSYAVGPEGKVTGLEYSEEFAEIAKKGWADNGVKNCDVIVGDAHAILPALNPSEPYDLIFIDAEKSGYPDYLKTILERSAPGAAHRLLKPGGMIVADNILRRGLVADSTDANPWVVKEKTQRASYWTDSDVTKLDEFNTTMATNPRIEAFLLPLFDGVGLGRLLD